jgi:hypothetical protein
MTGCAPTSARSCPSECPPAASLTPGPSGLAGGPVRASGEAAAHQAGDLTIVDIPMSFEAAEMKGRVVYDKDGKVAGLFVLNSEI